MELTCKARLVTLFVRNSFKRLVPSLVYLGIKAKDPLEPLLVLATDNIILEFKVTGNVKRIYKKELDQGRVGFEFFSPPHQVLIITPNVKELYSLLKLFHQVMDRAVMEKLEHIPILSQFSTPTSKSKAPFTASKIEWESSSICYEIKLEKVPLNLRERISKYLIEIDLPKCHLKEIPVELGEISVERINLESNEITSENLAFLDELPIRKSLKYLNFAENKIDIFPSVLTDFASLTVLNFRDNSIETIPCGISQMRILKYLNMSGNNIRYLPATMDSLKLSEVDLTYNYLTSNVRTHYRPRLRNTSKNCSRLRDLCVISVKSSQRRHLINKQFPRSLIEDLRRVSKCICGHRTIPHRESQFYEMLDRVNFALTYRIHPQKLCFTDEPLYGIRHKGNGIGNVFLEFHFCSNCEDEYVQFNNKNEYNCFQLSDISSLHSALLLVFRNGNRCSSVITTFIFLIEALILEGGLILAVFKFVEIATNPHAQDAIYS